jgi:hypothetical protein
MSTLKVNQIQTDTGKPILNSTGSVLKVASNSITTAISTALTSLVPTGLITTMTPTNTNSNFFVMLSHGRWTISPGNGIVMNMYVSVNGGTYAATFPGNRNETLHYSSSGAANGQWSYSCLYVPATSVSSISFQPYFRTFNGGNLYFNIGDANGYGEVFLTVFEISA